MLAHPGGFSSRNLPFWNPATCCKEDSLEFTGGGRGVMWGTDTVANGQQPAPGTREASWIFSPFVVSQLDAAA